MSMGGCLTGVLATPTDRGAHGKRQARQCGHIGCERIPSREIGARERIGYPETSVETVAALRRRLISRGPPRKRTRAPGQAVGFHTMLRLRRTLILPPCGRAAVNSLGETRQRGRLDIFPGGYIARICLVFSISALKLRALCVGKRDRVAIRRNAVPDFLDKS